jgi:hypothetical protein
MIIFAVRAMHKTIAMKPVNPLIILQY